MQVQVASQSPTNTISLCFHLHANKPSSRTAMKWPDHMTCICCWKCLALWFLVFKLYFQLYFCATHSNEILIKVNFVNYCIFYHYCAVLGNTPETGIILVSWKTEVANISLIYSVWWHHLWMWLLLDRSICECNFTECLTLNFTRIS